MMCINSGTNQTDEYGRFFARGPDLSPSNNCIHTHQRKHSASKYFFHSFHKLKIQTYTFTDHAAKLPALWCTVYTVFHKKPDHETSCYNFKKTALISKKRRYKQSTHMTKVIVNVQNVVLWP